MNARCEFESIRIERSTTPLSLRPGNSGLVRLSTVHRSSKPSREYDQDPSDTTP